jgi:hypothetical protein
VIGDRLRGRIGERRVAEVSVAVDVLNRMLELGRPSYVRIVGPQTGIGVIASISLIPAPHWQPGQYTDGSK